ncbi:MAG: hypothetical protein JW878_00015 [Methanomicrobia archaeon]|nr:hypothetical protein [Methanomicrobia archaeon]
MSGLKNLFIYLSDFGFSEWLLKELNEGGESSSPLERLLLERYKIGTFSSLDNITILSRELSVLTSEREKENFLTKKILVAWYYNSYSALKLLGYDELAEEIAIQLSLDPSKAALLLCASRFIIRSYLSPLREIVSMSRGLKKCYSN